MSYTQLQTLSIQFNSILNEYKTTYHEFVTNIDSDEKRIYYSKQLQKLNQQLLDINTEISNAMKDSYGSYVKNIHKSNKQEEALLLNYTVLEEEKQKIDHLVTQFQTLHSAQENGEATITMNYYNYIILVFIVILLVGLFLKFTVTSTQNGGGIFPSIYKSGLYN